MFLNRHKSTAASLERSYHARTAWAALCREHNRQDCLDNDLLFIMEAAGRRNIKARRISDFQAAHDNGRTGR